MRSKLGEKKVIMIDYFVVYLDFFHFWNSDIINYVLVILFLILPFSSIFGQRIGFFVHRFFALFNQLFSDGFLCTAYGVIHDIVFAFQSNSSFNNVFDMN